MVGGHRYDITAIRLSKNKPIGRPRAVDHAERRLHQSAGFIAQRSGSRDFFYILQKGNTGLEGNVIYEWGECAVIG